jgi:cytochrome c oxidase subunit 2
MTRRPIRMSVVGAALALGVVIAAPAGAQPASAVPQNVPSGGAPMNYMASSGAVGDAITPLVWGLVVLSIVVVVIMGVLVILAVTRHWGRSHRGLPPVERPARGIGWIYWGVGLSLIPLLGFTGWTVATMAAIGKPPREPPFTVTVAAEQWWWKLTYDDGTASRTFTTANEVHVPVGVPVHFEITSDDVIHSFWIPALGGKTDAIPGRVNETWLQADKPGIYRGQCVEYCGLEHALMALELVAEPQREFDAWWTAQLTAPPPPTSAGGQLFLLDCGGCHTVRGTPAGGIVGPDLSHLMSRRTIAAGILGTTPANLAGWIADPQGIKPGSKMPDVELTGPDLQAILSYMETLE